MFRSKKGRIESEILDRFQRFLVKTKQELWFNKQLFRFQLRIHSREGLSEFAEFTKRTFGSETGAVGKDFGKLVDSTGETKFKRIWSSTIDKTAVENAFRHWEKLASEFPEFQNSLEYVVGADKFMTKPPVGTLMKIRPNGDKLFYNPSSNIFGIQTKNGAPRTLFRPEK